MFREQIVSEVVEEEIQCCYLRLILFPSIFAASDELLRHTRLHIYDNQLGKCIPPILPALVQDFRHFNITFY